MQRAFRKGLVDSSLYFPHFFDSWVATRLSPFLLGVVQFNGTPVAVRCIGHVEILARDCQSVEGLCAVSYGVTCYFSATTLNPRHWHARGLSPFFRFMVWGFHYLTIL